MKNVVYYFYRIFAINTKSQIVCNIIKQMTVKSKYTEDEIEDAITIATSLQYGDNSEPREGDILRVLMGDFIWVYTLMSNEWKFQEQEAAQNTTKHLDGASGSRSREPPLGATPSQIVLNPPTLKGGRGKKVCIEDTQDFPKADASDDDRDDKDYENPTVPKDPKKADIKSHMKKQETKQKILTNDVNKKRKLDDNVEEEDEDEFDDAPSGVRTKQMASASKERLLLLKGARKTKKEINLHRVLELVIMNEPAGKYQLATYIKNNNIKQAKPTGPKAKSERQIRISAVYREIQENYKKEHGSIDKIASKKLFGEASRLVSQEMRSIKSRQHYNNELSGDDSDGEDDEINQSDST